MFQAGDDSSLFLSKDLTQLASDLMQKNLDAKGDQVIRRRAYYLSVLGGKMFICNLTDFEEVPSVTLMSGANLYFFCAVLKSYLF